MDTQLTVEIETLLIMKFVLKSRSVTTLFSELLQSLIPFCMINTCYGWYAEYNYSILFYNLFPSAYRHT